MDALSGTLPKSWDWVSLATYEGNTTYKHVVYDEWYYYVRIILLALLPSYDVYQLCTA